VTGLLVAHRNYSGHMYLNWYW